MIMRTLLLLTTYLRLHSNQIYRLFAHIICERPGSNPIEGQICFILCINFMKKLNIKSKLLCLLTKYKGDMLSDRGIYLPLRSFGGTPVLQLYRKDRLSTSHVQHFLKKKFLVADSMYNHSSDIYFSITF